MTATTLTGADSDAQFVELLERHRGIVFKVAATYCRNPADREDVAQAAVVRFGPELRAARGVHELRGDTQPVTVAPHAAFENVAHAERRGNVANVLVLVFE